MWLTEYPYNATVAATAVVKNVGGYDIKTAKALVDSIPSIFKSEISYYEALDFQNQLLKYNKDIPVYSVIVPTGTQPEL